MAQFGRPDSNVTQTSFTGGFAEIDEATASDVDFAYGANNTAAELEIGLSDVTDPVSSMGHVFRYRIAKTNAGTVDGGGNAVTVTARLMQGLTQIATDTAKTANGTWTQYAYTLSAAEADAITDYPDLRLEFLTSASGGSPAARRGGAVSWAELETPDAGVTAKSGSDSGSAADASVETATLVQPDTATGTELAAEEATQSVAEVGTGAESSSLVQEFQAADSGVGAETAALTAAAVGAETGTGADISVETAAASAADAGVGSELAALFADYVLTDGAGGAEAATQAADFVVAESGSGIDAAVLTQAFIVSETGSGFDAAALGAAYVQAEAGSASEQAALMAAYVLSETAVASDAGLAAGGDIESGAAISPAPVGTIAVGSSAAGAVSAATRPQGTID